MLATATGGTGRFYTVHAIFGDEAGGFRDVASVTIGDRIAVQGVEMVDGTIEVSILDRAVDEAFSVEPHVPVLVRLAFEDGLLAEEPRSELSLRIAASGTGAIEVCTRMRTSSGAAPAGTELMASVLTTPLS